MARGTKTYTTGKIRSSRTNSIINTYSNVNPAGIFQAGTDYEFQKEYYAPELNSIDCIDPDVSPNPYTFTDVTGSNISTVNTSNTITISGLGSGNIIAVSIIGGEYSKNGGAYTSSVGTATNADTFAVRATSSSLYITAVNVTLTTGDYSDTYTITTKVAPAVTVNYSLTKDTDPHVESSIHATANSVNVGRIYPTSTGIFPNTFAGNNFDAYLIHTVVTSPWPADSSGRLIVKEDAVEIYNSGLITNPTLEQLSTFDFNLLEGKVYDVIAVTDSSSTAYTASSFSMSNLSTAPLTTTATFIVSAEIIDNTDSLYKLYTAQYTQPQNNIGFNWLTDANTGSVRIVNNSEVSLDFTLSNIAEGGVYTNTQTVIAGTSYTWTGLVKSGYSVSYVDTPSSPPIACGVATSYSGGESFPTTQVITLGSSTGTVTLTFDGLSVPDKFIVMFDGVEVINTGYRGSTSEQANLDAALAARGLPSETITSPGNGSASFVKSTTTTTATVYVYAPISGTAWNFNLGCPL